MVFLVFKVRPAHTEREGDVEDPRDVLRLELLEQIGTCLHVDG